MNRYSVFVCMFYIIIQQASSTVIEGRGDAFLLNEGLKIGRMSLSTMNVEILPMKNMSFANAIEYDIKHDCIFWADNTVEIRRQCFNNNNQNVEVLHAESDGDFFSLAYDWTSELLYFTNRVPSKIEVISTSSNSPRLHRTIVQLEPRTHPSGIAIHPRSGYIFWTSRKPSISRANLDGSNVRTLIEKPDIGQPYLVTVDFETERIFWTDLDDKNIASCDFHGKHFYVVWKNADQINIPYSLAIHNDTIYWGDYDEHTFLKAKVKEFNESSKSFIFMTLDDYACVTTVMKNVTYYHVRLIAEHIQSETNACSGRHNCSHVCVGAPNSNYSCI